MVEQLKIEKKVEVADITQCQWSESIDTKIEATETDVAPTKTWTGRKIAVRIETAEREINV